MTQNCCHISYGFSLILSCSSLWNPAHAGIFKLSFSGKIRKTVKSDFFNSNNNFRILIISVCGHSGCDNNSYNKQYTGKAKTDNGNGGSDYNGGHKFVNPFYTEKTDKNG